MKKVGLILVLVVVTVAAWAGWTYATTEDTLLDIGSRLPAEEALNAMPFEETVEQLKLAMIQCDRLSWLEVNPLARLLRGDEIKSLAEHCELIKSRQESLQGP
jgi:hypothetical protein